MTTLNLEIANNNDDGYEKEEDGSIDRTEVHVRTKNSTGGARRFSAHRFIDNSMNQGDTANSCTVTVEINGADDTRSDWHFERADAPLEIGTGTNDITGRTLTTSSVRWSVQNLGTGPASPPDMTAELQEVLDNHTPTALVVHGVPTTLTSRELRYDALEDAGTTPVKCDIDFTAAVGNPWNAYAQQM